MPLGSLRDSIVFYESLRAMERGGVSIVRSLGTIAESSPARTRPVVRRLESIVAGGSPLSAAMDRFPEQFPRLERSLIRAGETGGRMEESIEAILRVLRRSLETRNQVIQAAIYPVILVHAAMLIPPVAVLLQNGLFAYLATVLPTLGVFYGVAVAAVALNVLARRGGTLGALWDGLKLRLPILGRIFEHAALGRFTRSLGALMQSGVPILIALDQSIETAGNTVIRARLAAVIRGVEGGKTLPGALRDAGPFPLEMHALIETGEQSGAMTDCLERVANHLDDRAHDSLLRLSKILPVGLLFLAMAYAIFRLLGQLTSVFEGLGQFVR